MDTKVAKGSGEVECRAADARGPYRRGLDYGLLTGRQDTGVGLERQHSQAVGRRMGALLQTPEGHADVIWAVAFSPDGTSPQANVGSFNLSLSISDGTAVSQPQDRPFIFVEDQWISLTSPLTTVMDKCPYTL
ncbi:hypothetical protein P152DRAFT_451401 [Eremomyces bilateralis CBS 781.70]|uniref:Uncharacterized protein n=1 Tax=Eremomyces bilateralis CBS 781.70 TaxID=1392243 RepID=A0A6G1FWF1_9PEZI|nr:uncharacterized protein P152DRAFT_451401 [Eremomyces bilateralis CBS 781.70]KAF1810016.1 hypothetical protein P152DRAFT_451401 [Eremomyces bilateralis CBS 781.70]